MSCHATTNDNDYVVVRRRIVIQPTGPLQTSTKVGDRFHRRDRVTTLHCLSSVVKTFLVVSFILFQMFLDLTNVEQTE